MDQIPGQSSREYYVNVLCMFLNDHSICNILSDNLYCVGYYVSLIHTGNLYIHICSVCIIPADNMKKNSTAELDQ